MSTPHFDPDDPRLTAYALGEGTADERQAVEQLLAVSPEAREVVEQTRTFALRLEDEYLRENTAYQQAHPQPTIPTNVVPFPGSSRRRWQPAMAWAWKVAAVFVAAGSLVWLATRRPPVATVVSLQTQTPTGAAAAKKETAPATVDQLKPLENNNALLAAAAPNPETRDRTAKLDVQLSATDAFSEAPPAVAFDNSPGASENADATLALAPAPAASAGASEPGEPPPAPAADMAAQAPAAAEAPLLAAARPAPPPAAPKSAPTQPVQDRPAAAIVRVRQADGTFVGGVLLSADGRLLAATKSPAADKAVRMTVVLADRREFNVTRAGTTDSFGLLQVSGSSLPWVRLAENPPGDGSTLLAARVDPRTGDTTITRARAKQSGGRVYLDGADGDLDFVFNAAGELLAMQPAASSLAKSATRARAAVRREVSAFGVVRPYTAEERAALTRSLR